MQIRTKGDNPKVPRKELRYAARFMAGLLMSSQLCERLFVKIHSVKNLQLNQDYVDGYVIVLGKDDPPRRFHIYIDSNMGRRYQLLTLAHEITHVKQIARGEKKWCKNEVIKWKSKPVDVSKVGYYFQPWEIESNGYEPALYNSYKDHIEEANINF